MTAKEVLRNSLTMTKMMANQYMADLDDADLQVRPIPEANNVAWQIGHLIASEASLGAEVGITYPDLPPVIRSLSSGASAKTHGDGGNLSKAQYLDLFNKVRDASIEGLNQMPDDALDTATKGPMKDFAPTVAAMLGLLGMHTMMHVGQFTVVRRLLKKPVLM